MILVNRDSGQALRIWTLFGAMLKIESIEFIFKVFVSTVDFLDLRLQTFIQVDSGNLAPFEGMCAVFAVETKQKLTVLAPTGVFRLFKVGETLAAWHGTPADVFHLRDSELETELLVLLHQLVAQPHTLDIVVVQTLSA